MPDVKKLIVGFLILAAGASSSALVLSSMGGANSAANGATAGALNGSVQSATTLNGNAFANDSAAAGAGGQTADGSATATNLDGSPTDPSAISAQAAAQLAADPANLTNALSDAFLNNLVAANPDGSAQTDASGNMLVSQPNDQAVIKQFTGSGALANLKVPNWDIEAAEQTITVKATYTAADLNNYASAVGSIIDKYTQATNLESILQSGDPTSAQFAESNLASALSDVTKLSTPAPFANFQKSLVKLLVYEKNYAALAINASDDPIKTQLIANAEEAKFNAAATELNNETQKLAKKTVSANKNGGAIGIETSNPQNLFSFINNLFGIQSAHAQAFVPVFDTIHTAATHAQTAIGIKQYLLTYLQNTILQIEKNLLMALVQQKVLTWIQGSGAPRFITNWGSTIVNTYAAAAVANLNDQFQCVPNFMLPSLRVLLVSPNLPGSSNACATQFNSQLGNNLQNLQNFYNNFANGGFNSYFSLFQPNGNAFGMIISMSDNAAAAGSNAQSAATAKITSAQGYNGSETCTDNGAVYVGGKYTPDGSHYVCQSNTYNYTAQATMVGGAPTCVGTQTLTIAANGHLCANGSTPQVTTPGNVANQANGIALDSTPKLIAGSYEITGLVAAFVQSLLNTLAQSAINYSTKSVNGVLQPGTSQPQDSGITGVPVTYGSDALKQSQDDLSKNKELGVSCISDNANPALDPATGGVTVNFQAIGGALDQGDLPTYTWTPSSGSATTANATGTTYSETYSTPGTYTVSVNASVDQSTSNCTVVVTNAPPAGGICGNPPSQSGTCSNPATPTCTNVGTPASPVYTCQ